MTVPGADPYLLPMVGLLTAIGVTEIYRLGTRTRSSRRSGSSSASPCSR